ncbi:hypothetical protein E2C01_083201 [Portunus trituberculatus]|uniref:Uncharacterized protein n=1 Tax=Portunus trituberculatus TaxID=210409 RepID=A0A5B7IUH8_PORTR|nr:hypothetical protein [Portunus trituberculatus]
MLPLILLKIHQTT